MCAPNFEVSCPTFECQMRRLETGLQRFAPNVRTFWQNVRANLTNFVQDLFWRMTFSNEDFKITLYNVCSVHQGMFSTSGGCHEYVGGDIMSISGGYHEYIGGCSVHRGISWCMWGISWVHQEMFGTSGDTMSALGDIMSTSGDVQHIRGYHDACGGMPWVHWGMFSTLGIPWVHQGKSWVHRGISWVHQGMFSTLGFSIKIEIFLPTCSPHASWYPPDVLNIPQCTHDIPPMYSWYPPDVLMVSSDVLNIPRCTHDIPPHASWYPPTCIMISPDVLMISPNVLMIIPPTYWTPPMYWTSPDGRYTEHTLYRVKMVEDGLASLAIVKIWTGVFLDQHAAQSVGCEEESKKIYFSVKSKQIKMKEKGETRTLKVQGGYLAWLCLWGSLSPEIGQGLHTYIH